MDKEQVRIKIEETLKKMNCTDISFLETDENTITVVFNCKELTSFVGDTPDWIYSGIQINSTQEHQYRLNFKKVS